MLCNGGNYTRANPNSQETQAVKKWRHIGHLQALSPWSNVWIDVFGGLLVMCSPFAIVTQRLMWNQFFIVWVSSALAKLVPILEFRCLGNTFSLNIL